MQSFKSWLYRHRLIVSVAAGVVLASVIFVVALVNLLIRPQPDAPSETAPSEISSSDSSASPEISAPTILESETDPAQNAPSSAEPDPAKTAPAPIKTALSPTAQGANCSINLGILMLINPNYTVTADYIARRRTELISLSQTYGIPEYRATNGDNLLDPAAAGHLNEMLQAYAAENPGHTMGTRSCFRERGTNCGRLCLATGTSDHHTGLTCDLIDNAYGTSLDTDTLPQHLEWQWLKNNSYKYGFIDRYPLAWAGSSMNEPMNVNAAGTTGLYEAWHYRYVGIAAATEIATGKYNSGAYDSLEHYLLATGRLADLLTPTCPTS